jgi:hypothetical protein
MGNANVLQLGYQSKVGQIRIDKRRENKENVTSNIELW